MNPFFRICIVLIWIGLNANAQISKECNRKVLIEDYRKDMPVEVCLAKGDYCVRYVHTNVDVNVDGRMDYVFKWGHDPLREGDTLFTSIYMQNKDSSFYLFKTMDNLYPYYFDSYNSDYSPEDTSLIEIYQKYMGNYWLYELKIDKNFIIIDRKLDAESHLIVYYKFDQITNNWVLEKCEEDYIYHNTRVRTNKYDSILGPTIDDFTYFMW